MDHNNGSAKSARGGAAGPPVLSFDVPFFLNEIPTIPQPPQLDAHRREGRHVALSLQDILGTREWHSIVFSNYMTDLAWLAQALPTVFGPRSATQVGFFYGEESGQHILDAARAGGFASRVVFAKRPPLPIPYGTHHTKAIFAFTHDLCAVHRGDDDAAAAVGGGAVVGVRVAILTSNFLYDDVLRKNQGFFVQDFPLLKKEGANINGSVNNNDFGQRLIEYLTVVGAGRLLKPLDGLECVDFTAAGARLVASVPGYHQTPGASSWGQARLARVLRQSGPTMISTPAGRQRRSLVWQYSSQGSLTDPFLVDLRTAMSQQQQPQAMGGGTVPSTLASSSLPLDVSAVVLPSQEEVRCSVEGWRAGLSIPIMMKVLHPFINARLHRFTPRHHFSPVPVTSTPPPLSWPLREPLGMTERTRGAPVEKRFHTVAGRHRAMPHIKSYACVVVEGSGGDDDGEDASNSQTTPPYLAWLCCTSANLSRAAWGDWQKKGAQLMIRSYELGLVYSPEMPPVAAASFTLTPGRPIRPLGVLRPAASHDAAALLAHLQLGYGAWPSFLGAAASSASIGGGAQQRALFLPYALHALRPYAASGGGPPRDIPWAVDFPHQGPDILRQQPSVLAAYSHYGAGSWTAEELSWQALDVQPSVAATLVASESGGGGSANGGTRDDPMDVDRDD